MFVYSAMGRNPLNLMILIRASHSSTLRVSVPSLLKTELWVSKCQHAVGGKVNCIGRSRMQLHPHHCWLCQQLQVWNCRWDTQEWTQVKEQSGGQLVPYFSSLSRAICIEEFYHRVIQLASIATKIKVAPSRPEPGVIIYPFNSVDEDQVTPNINSSTHRQLKHFSKMMARYTSLCIPVWQHRLYHSSAIVRAGHNKWSKVKHKKKFTDLEKSRTIHKYVTLITSAIKAGGGPDPDSNVRLAGVIESARKAGNLM